MAYKLVAYAGRPVLKLSPGKATLPGGKQVWRNAAQHGTFEDLVGLADEPGPASARPLLVEAMRNGQRLYNASLVEARGRAKSELTALPANYRVLVTLSAPPVQFSPRLRQVRGALTAELTESVPAIAASEGGH
jgi:nicotinate phosphoribosyltransferase